MYYLVDKNLPSEDFCIKSVIDNFPLYSKYSITGDINEDGYYPIVVMSFRSFNNLHDMLIYFYQKCYPQLIKELIKHCKVTYEWKTIFELSPSQIATDDMYLSAAERPLEHNAYLAEVKQTQLTALGEDILVNGMYFPFLGDGSVAGYGGHRLISLQEVYKERPFDKKFLYLTLPAEYQTKGHYMYYNYNLGNLNEAITIPMIDIETCQINFAYTTNLNFIWNIFTYTSDWFGDVIHQVKDLVQPSVVFNNPQAFEEFLNADI